MAHRWAYRHFVGRIPENSAVSRVCEHSLCVNPAHLTLVTRNAQTASSDQAPPRELASTSYLERFNQKWQFGDGVDACWFWIGALNRAGYGMLQHKATDGSKGILAHRFAYGYFKGAIPKGMSVLHRCDNPSCVNPLHLHVGTHVDNMREMVMRGRSKPKTVYCRKRLHILDEKNTYTQPKAGTRLCRMCRQARQVEYTKQSQSK